MQGLVSWRTKFGLNFMLYLPVIIIVSLIFVIYFGYVFTYIVVLLNPSEHMSNTDELTDIYPFFTKSSPESTILKGKILLGVVTSSLVLLVIAMMRAVFMDPG